MRRLHRLPRLRNAYLRRGLIFWVGVRVAAAWVGITRLGVIEVAGVLALVALMTVLDARRRWEDVLLGNLGIPLREAAGWSLPGPLLMEAVLPGPAAGELGGVPGFGAVAALDGGTGHSGVASGGREDAPLLELDGVGKSIRGREVLKAASLRVLPGRITALMGRNGSGKTTLLRIAVGRVGAGHGRVLWRGRHLPRPRLYLLAREGLFFSAQESALTDLFTVREQLDALVKVYGGAERMDALVGRMRVGPFLHRRPRAISGGERQRVSLVLAMLRAPSCLLMDEPFSGVAPRDRLLLAQGIRDLREAGCGVVVTGHDVQEVLDVADEVVWMTAGTTQWLGSPGEAVQHRGFRRDYLGPPSGG